MTFSFLFVIYFFQFFVYSACLDWINVCLFTKISKRKKINTSEIMFSDLSLFIILMVFWWSIQSKICSSINFNLKGFSTRWVQRSNTEPEKVRVMWHFKPELNSKKYLRKYSKDMCYKLLFQYLRETYLSERIFFKTMYIQ